MRETLVILLLGVAAAILAVALVTAPGWLPKLWNRDETCEACEAKCKPFAVRDCYITYGLSCYCDASRRQPVALEK